MNERLLVATTAPWASIVGYSRAVRVGDTIHVSGTAPVAEDGSIAHPGDPYRQTLRCLDIIDQALREVGAGLEHVVRTRMFVRETEHWEAVGRAHGERLGSVRPATTMVFTRMIHPEILVEVEADAAL